VSGLLASPGRSRVGFFGKLPSRGDFVQAGLSRPVVEAWDGWVQANLPAALAALDDQGGDGWDAPPPWRFVLPDGLCGPRTLCGVWMPSRDAVGRPFPLLAAAEAAEPDDALLDGIEFCCGRALAEAQEPGRLAAALDALEPVAAVSAPTVSRWWRGPNGDRPAMRLELPAMPDPDDLRHMLACPR
jgi:type VI secretion system protein ImpM